VNYPPVRQTKLRTVWKEAVMAQECIGLYRLRTLCKALVKIGVSEGCNCHVMHSTCTVKDTEILFWPQQFPV